MPGADGLVLVLLGFIMGYCIKGLSGDGSIINIYTGVSDKDDELKP